MSFKKAREQLLWAFDENFISAEEFLLLYDVNKSTNLDLPYDEYSPFDPENNVYFIIKTAIVQICYCSLQKTRVFNYRCFNC